MERIGRYEVVERLGSGGFATVYRVRDPVLYSEVAAKVLADNWSGEDEIRNRFINEARLLRQIDSDRVVTVHDIGELPSGQPYFIMALADRGTLEDRLRSVPSAPDPADLSAIGERLAECVGTVHSHNLIHRDIKPGNLLIAASKAGASQPRPGRLLAPYERLILGDFGLAKDIALQQSGMTMAGGTSGYAAPEQMTPSGAPDRRTDLYAATGVMYRVIAGEHPPPFVAGSRSVSFDDSQWWMAGALGAFFRRGMAFEQEHRHHSAEAWRAELMAAMSTSLGATPATAHTVAAPHTPVPSFAPPAPAAPPGPPVQSAPQPVHGPNDHSSTVVSAPPSQQYPAPTPSNEPPFHYGGYVAPEALGLPPLPKTTGRRFLLPAAVAGLLAVVGLGGWFLLSSGSGVEIIGDIDEIPAGESATYTASYEGAESYTWTDWNGERQDGDQFVVNTIVPGSLTFSVVAITEDGGESDSTSKTVTVVESDLQPTIDGPEQITIGETGTFTYTAPAGHIATNPRWIDAGTGGWKEGEVFTLTPSGAGIFTVTLAVTLNDGTNVGATYDVEIVEAP